MHVAPDGTIKPRFVPTGLRLDAPGENITENAAGHPGEAQSQPRL
jgi:hypothetical protein